MTDVFIYKLKTGEEIIGEFIEDTEDIVTIAKVRAIHPMTSPEGISIAIIPYLYGVDLSSELDFYYDDIITFAEPTPEMQRDYYQQITGLDIAASFGV